MKSVKMPTSDGYREFLIECLKDPEHAAGYIEAILEEKDPEPELLRNALRKVIEAYVKSDFDIMRFVRSICDRTTTELR